MEIKKQNEIEINTIGNDIETRKANISEENKEFLFEILSKNLYSNPIGSIVREITSNCFDSHIEAGVDKAVIINRGYDDEGLYISFQDFGVGLSPDRIEKIFMNYLSSTKRGTNNQIGGWGLGSKSPLAYADYFHIITIFDKIEYSYILSKGSDGVPILDLLNSSETNKGNGTTIKINIKDWEKGEESSWNYQQQFKKELQNQLTYFDNVYFNNWEIKNDYIIFNKKYFKYRNDLNKNEELHIILGKVKYPISWKEIELSPVKIPFGVKFEIGELPVLPNREQIRYTSDTKELIKERINLVINEIKELIIEQNKPINNFIDFYKKEKDNFSIKFNDNNYLDISVEIFPDLANLFTLSYIPNNFKFLLKRNGRDLLDKLYYCNVWYAQGKQVKNRNKSLNECITSNYSFTISDKYPTKIETWLKASLVYQKENKKYFNLFNQKTKDRIFISRTNPSIVDSDNPDKEKYFNNLKFGNEHGEYFILGKHKELYQVIKQIKQDILNYSYQFPKITQEIQKEYKDSIQRENTSLQRKLSGIVRCVRYPTKQSFEWSYTTKQSYLDIPSIERYRGIIIYGYRDDNNKLEKAHKFLKQFKTLLKKEDYIQYECCIIIQINKQFKNFFMNKPNAIHVDDLYSDNLLFRRLASSYKIEEYFKEVSYNMDSHINDYIKEIGKISIELQSHYKNLMNYYKKYSNDSNSDRQEIKEEILKIANQFNLFDSIIDIEFKHIDSYFKGIEYLKFLPINDKTIPLLLMELKSKGKKINLEYYQKAIIRTETNTQVKTKNGQLLLHLFNEEQSNQTKFKLLTKTI